MDEWVNISFSHFKLREKCPSAMFSLAIIFLYLDLIQENLDYKNL